MPSLPDSPTHVNRSRMSRQLDDHIDRYGRWFIYLRTDQRFHCPCWNASTDGPTVDICPFCVGSGWKTRAERMKAFLSAPENISSLVTTVNIGDWGRLDQYPGVLYAHSSSHVQQDDLILDVGWDRPNSAVPNGGRTTEMHRPWKISTLVPVVFNKDAAVDYYLCGLEQHTLQVDQFASVVRNLPLTTQSPVRGGHSYSDRQPLARASRFS